MCDIRRNVRYAISVFSSALKIQTKSRRRWYSSLLQPRSRFSERGRQRPLFLSFFPWRLNSERELCLRLATTSSIIECYFRARTLRVNRRVFIMCCALRIFDCTAVDCPAVAEVLFSKGSRIICEWSHDAEALKRSVRQRLLLNYIPFAQGVAYKSFLVKQEWRGVS